MQHPVVWFEVLGKDAQKLRGFYGELFGWKFNVDNPMNYGMLDPKATTRGIPGGIGEKSDKYAHAVTFYVEAKDIPAVLEHVERLGGKTVLPLTRLPGTTLALFKDPEGNVIGLVEPQ